MPRLPGATGAGSSGTTETAVRFRALGDLHDQPAPQRRHLLSFQHLVEGRWNRDGDPMYLSSRAR
jgi:hypothetical protein